MRTHKASLFAAIALIAVSASTAGAAVIVYLDQDIPIPTTYAGVSVNLETGAFSDVLAGVSGGDMNFVFGGAGFSNDADQTVLVPTWQPVRAGTGNTDVLVNLGINTTVGPSSVVSSDYGGSTGHFTTSLPVPAAPFTSGQKGYIGFSVVLDDTTVAYGWAEVTLQNDNMPGVIHSWAYEDTGQDIRVLEIPEPSLPVLTTLGLALLALRRRR
jgi:hypothetical protein